MALWATVEGKTVPAESMTPESGMPRGLKSIENEHGSPFPSTAPSYTATDAGSRVSPAPSRPMSHNLSGNQFGSSYMPGLRENLQARGAIPHGLGKAQSPMEAYRSNLRGAMLGSAGSSHHSLGAALNADPTMTNAIVNSGGQTASRGGGGLGNKLRGLLGSRLGSGGNSGGGKRTGRIARPKPSVHAGKNAAHLANATGSKG